MAEILDLYPTAEPPRPQRRMVLLSRGLSILFAALLAAYALAVAVMLLAFLLPFAGDHLALGPKGGLIHFGSRPLPPAYIPVADLPLGQRLAHVPVGLLHAAPVLLIFWSLRRLFALYGQGVVFAGENAAVLKLAGAGLAAHAVAPAVGFFVLNSFGLAIDRVWLHGGSFGELVLGAVVYVIAEVMALGREIEEERSQFV